MSDWREISGDQNLRLSQKMLEQQGEMNQLKQQLGWYQRRVKVLGGLLACYRAGSRPTEKLHLELDLTGQYVNHDGTWHGERAKKDSTDAH